MSANAKFLFGLEQECLTVAAPPSRSVSVNWINELFVEMGKFAPTLPGPSGVFNAYGRLYLDGGNHLEVATAECDSPYQLPTILEQQFALLAQALKQLPVEKNGIVLAANNHGGLLHAGAPTWGTHENYLVEMSPRLFADRILPFLVTRTYAGAGGILAPSGRYVSGVRSLFLKTDVGGDTTSNRAIHSTAREEPHSSGTQNTRYHLILGDGLRSHFGIALRAGATALALKAIFHDPERIQRLSFPSATRSRLWLESLDTFNHLADPDQPPIAHPLALRVQRVYLDAARAFADKVAELPDWVQHTLADWETTLQKLAEDDRSWLAARLDPWIKHELYSAWLSDRGHRWEELCSQPLLLAEMALFDQNYHEFANPDSPFARAESAGVLRHRVMPLLFPGDEPEPFVPKTTTRARARAEFLKRHNGDSSLVMNWAEVMDPIHLQRRSLADPFASSFGEWETFSSRQ